MKSKRILVAALFLVSVLLSYETGGRSFSLQETEGKTFFLHQTLTGLLNFSAGAESASEAAADAVRDESASDADLKTEGEEGGPEEYTSSVVPPETFRNLKKGSSGEDVQKLQLRLMELGYDPGSADGLFGSGTKEAVKDFQKRNSLSVDGVAGTRTQQRLYSAEAASPPAAADPVDVLVGKWPILTNLEYPVEETFIPADLVLMTDLCDESLIKIKYPDTKAVRTAVEALVTMLEAAKTEGITKWQCSAAYRSYAAQESLLNSKVNGYLRRNEGWSRSRARRAALKTVAEPGASEHHLGLAFDINVPGTSAFAGTNQCEWLHDNCWDYGFIIRYPEGKQEITGFTPEPWHIRYVGEQHALAMLQENLCLEEYLAKYHPAD